MPETTAAREAAGGDVVDLAGQTGDAAGFADVSFLLGDEPAAVLVVDLRTSRVTHVNSVAEQLAPDIELPCRLDEWSDSAELRDLDGGLLSATDHPLSRLGRVEPMTGQAVSAQRRSDMGRRRQPLWVVEIPMLGSAALTDHTMVLMLPVRLREVADAAQAGAASSAGGLGLHSRAVLATALSFTLGDATDPDLPLVWVNPAFTASTGYTADEAIGRNCRFLQGPGTDPDRVAQIRRSLAAGKPVSTTLLNYRKDGSSYWNQLNISPVHSPEGTLTHFVGVQTDVSRRVEADRARDAALEAERRARAAAELAEERLQLMADASTQLSRALDTADAHQQLASLLVPRVADFVMVLHHDGSSELTSVLTEHIDPDLQGRLAALSTQLASALAPGAPIEVILGPTGSRLLRDLDTVEGREAREAFVADRDYLDLSAEFPATSALMVPLTGRDAATGVLVLGRSSRRQQFDHPDLDLAVDLGRRAGLLLENTRLYELQRTNSEILQRSLLPELPHIPGVRTAARYHAGARGSQVGGDFYDLTTLADGTIALSVGDVAGHDMLAAAAMGQLRSLLRACVHDVGATPSQVLERVDRLLHDLQFTTVATLVQAFLQPTEAGWDVTWSNGGHPPPAMRLPGGEAAFLGSADLNDTLLGISTAPRHNHKALLPHGTLLLGYTDGLIERRHETIDLGMQRLLDQIALGPHDPVEAVDDLVDNLASGSEHEDDIALVAVLLE